MIVSLVSRYGEQIRVQLGSHFMALVVDVAIADGWAVARIIGGHQ